MGYSSFPESDDPAKKSTAQLENAGLQSPLLIPERNDDDWRKYSQASQKAQDFPLPLLEVKEDFHKGIPSGLLKLYGDQSLVPTSLLSEDAKPGRKSVSSLSELQPPWLETSTASTSDARPATPPPIIANASGYVTDVAYPDGKMRHIERDPQTHEATLIVTEDREGSTKLSKQGGQWFMEVQGMALPFPGKVEVSKDGDVSMQTTSNGVWRVEKANGDVTEEKENADGARVSFDSNHRLAKITRQDGTCLVQQNENIIVEARPGRNPIIWSNNGGVWTSDAADRPRKNLSLRDDGTVTFEDQSGIKHTVNGRGIETLEGAGFGRITPDASNRPSVVETADGKRLRKYEYFDEKGSDIKSVTIIDREKSSSVSYTRDSADSKQWKSERGSWSGEIKVSSDGVHSVRAAGYNQNSDSKWTSYHPDGRETTDSFANDGARLSYDKNNVLVSYRGPDGVRIDKLDNRVTHYDPTHGGTVTWSKGADGMWTSDSPQFKDARKDINISASGEFSYVNDKGGKVQEHRDGSKQIVDRDGTKLDFDRNGEIIRATKGNLERTFIRDSAGIVSVRDRNLSSKEEKSIFDRRPAGQENRSKIFVDRNGDLSYQNPDGSAVIERSNMLHIDLDKDGDIKRVVGPKSTREFQYVGDGDTKSLASIVDTRKTEKGEKTESWTRVANPDGTLSNEFRGVDDKGKALKSRYSVTPCADGEYEYRLATDRPGEKIHVERLNRQTIDGMPEGISEAREQLISQLEGVMDKSRLAQNIQFMKNFEKRMLDQTELEIAAGINPASVMKEMERQVVDTYYNCARLTVGQAQRQLYGQKDRIRLAENLLYLAADPTDIKQGNQGTCWWESSWNIGVFQRNAGAGSRLIADVALTGQYTSTAGKLRGGAPKTITVPYRYVNFSNHDSGGRWTPQNSRSSSARSMVGMMMDQIGPPLYGARSWGQSNAGDHSEARNIVYMITGKDEIRHGSSGLGRHEKLQLLKTGGWTSSGGGHMWGYSMHKDRDGGWVVIRDDQYQGADRVIARVRDLRSWITADVAADARKQWRASKPRPGESIDASPTYSSFASNNTFSSPRRAEDEAYGNRMKQMQMNRPKWTASSNRFA